MSNTDFTHTQEQNNGSLFVQMMIGMFVLVSIFCLALYKYDQSHNANAQAVTKARTAVSAANRQITATAAQNKVLSTQNGILSARNTELGNEKTQLCVDITKAKVIEPLCTNQ